MISSLVPTPNPSGAGTTIINNLPAASKLLPLATIAAGFLTFVGVVIAAVIARRNANKDREAAEKTATADRAAAQTTLDRTLRAADEARVEDRAEARRQREEDRESARTRRVEDLQAERGRREEEAATALLRRREDLDLIRKRRFEDKVIELLADLLSSMDSVSKEVNDTHPGTVVNQDLFMRTRHTVNKLRLYARQLETTNALRDFSMTTLRIMNALTSIAASEPVDIGGESDADVNAVPDNLDLFSNWIAVRHCLREELGIPDERDPNQVEYA